MYSDQPQPSKLGYSQHIHLVTKFHKTVNVCQQVKDLSLKFNEPVLIHTSH